MNLLLESYIFYMDVYIFQNLFMKATVLYLSLYVNKQIRLFSTGKGIVKIIGASFCVTILEIICLLLIDSYMLFLFLSYVVEIPISIWILTEGESGNRIRIIMTGYLFTIIVNGVLEVLWNYGGRNGSYLFFLIATGGIVLLGVRIWKKDYEKQKGVYPVKLLHGEKVLASYGLYDSGNRLKDPYTGKGVYIVSEQLFRKLEMEEQSSVYVPYASLGNEQGLMEVYYIDKIQIFREQDCVEQQKIPIGRTTDHLFEWKSYEIILNEEVF